MSKPICRARALGRDGRLVGLGEGEADAWQIGGLVLAAHACRRAEDLTYHAGSLDRGCRHEENGHVRADRNRLGLVLQDFDAHAVRRRDESLVRPAVAARLDRHARRFPLRRRILDVGHAEADMFNTDPTVPPVRAPGFRQLQMTTTPETAQPPKAQP